MGGMRGAVAVLCWLGFGPAAAQVVLDGSMGPAGALPGPHYVVAEGLGRTVGHNLFHSFAEFSVFRGQSATFTGSEGIANVLGRVTGGSASTIDGLIRSTIGGANLFLVNPSGVLFGPHASIDVSGSFHVSTADYVRFADGGRFTAVPSAHDGVLSVAAPAAFGFLEGADPAPIDFLGSGSEFLEVNGAFLGLPDQGLAVPVGETFSVVGGDIELGTGFFDASPFGFFIVQSRIRAPGGRVNLVAAAGAGEVPLDPAEVDGVEAFGTIGILDGTLLDTSGDPNGRVYVRGADVEVFASHIFSDALGEVDGSGFGVYLHGSNELIIHGNSFVTTDVVSGGSASDIGLRGGTVVVFGSTVGSRIFGASGDAGDVLAWAEDLLVDEFGSLESIVFSASGAGGTVRVEADQVTVDFGGRLFTGTDGSGDAGRVEVEATEVVVGDGARIQSFTFASGNAGRVDVDADTVTLDAGASIYSLLFTGHAGITSDALGGSGDAGGIEVTAEALNILHGSTIRSSTFFASTGDAGDILVEAGRIYVERANGPFPTGIDSSVEFGSFGLGGDVVVRAEDVEIRNGGTFRAVTFGVGDAGSVTVEADHIFISRDEHPIPTGITTNTTDFATGDAGRIFVDAGVLEVVNGGIVRSNTFAGGDAGRVEVNADRVFLAGQGSTFFTGITSGAEDGTGRGGEVLVTARDIEIRNAASIRAGTFTDEPGGSVRVVADRLLLDGENSQFPTGISSDAADFTSSNDTTGDAGSVHVRARQITIRDSAKIASVTYSEGDAGQITIDAGTILIDGDSSQFVTGIFGSTVLPADGIPRSGQGGSVEVRAERIDIRDAGAIGSDTRTHGDAGSVSITTGTLRIDGRNQINAFTGVSSDAAPGATGNAGTVRIRAGVVELVNAGQITTSTFGPGDGGDVRLRIAGSLDVVGRDGAAVSGIFATVETESLDSGAGGSIDIRAGEVRLADGGRIGTRSSGGGRSGDIRIDAGARLVMEDDASITTEAFLADGGNIAIRARDLVLVDSSAITATVHTGAGAGGNISIDPTFVILLNGQIVANAFGGPGGNITIVADNFFADHLSRISASSSQSIDGVVAIDAPDSDVAGELVVLSSEFVDPASRLAEQCAARGGRTRATFVGEGRGGLRPLPEGQRAAPFLVGSGLAMGGAASPAALGLAARVEGFAAPAATPQPHRFRPATLVLDCTG